MKSAHSWNWLVPRLAGRRMRSASSRKAIGRPCLAVEQLEDRNLLSASGADVTTGPPPSSSGGTEILIAQMSGGLAVTTDEVQLLQVLGTAAPAENKVTLSDIEIKKRIDKASPLLMQLNDTLFKVGEDLLKGDLTAQKLTAAESKIEYLKIRLEDIIISSVSLEEQKQATSKADDLFKLADTLIRGESKDTKHKDESIDLHLSAHIQAIENLVLKAEIDSFRKAGKGQEEFFPQDFQSKIEDEFQQVDAEIMKLGDPAASLLLPAVQEFHTGISGLLGSLSGDGNFDGGIVVPPSDDIIT